MKQLLPTLVRSIDAFEYQPAHATKTGVVQRFSYASVFSPEIDRIWQDTVMRVAENLTEQFQLLGQSELLLGGEYIPNDSYIQRYSPSESGITPHKDQSAFLNLICILLVKGASSFHTCDDREYTNSLGIPAQPGDLIVMRGNGFDGANIRPFHYVGEITKERVSLGMRQMSHDPSAQVRVEQTYISVTPTPMT